MHENSMATAIKLVTTMARQAAKDSPLTPELKAFIDRVIVPALGALMSS
jgi:hypothetical protein